MGQQRLNRLWRNLREGGDDARVGATHSHGCFSFTGVLRPYQGSLQRQTRCGNALPLLTPGCPDIGLETSPNVGLETSSNDGLSLRSLPRPRRGSVCRPHRREQAVLGRLQSQHRLFQAGATDAGQGIGRDQIDSIGLRSGTDLV